MQGRSAEALQATRDMREHVPDAMLQMGGGLDWYMAERYFVLERFGRWRELLAEPAPDAKLHGLGAAYRYARACAFAATGDVAHAREEKARLDAIAAALPAGAPAGLNTAKDLLAVATAVAAARIAVAEGDRAAAIAGLLGAAANEDLLAYDEPANWFVPVRHLLGAQLLAEGRAAEAEAVYREDLRLHPANGWALHGLAQALKAQHRQVEADAVARDFAAAWKDADIRIDASAF